MLALPALVLLVVLMGAGVPVAWAFAAALAYLSVVFDANLNTLMLQGYRSLNSVILVALPLFILTGYLMQAGGIAQRIVALMERLATGRGGMGSAMVLSSAVFGAISGTATAAIASIGAIMSDPLAARGYPRGRIAALLGISSLLGILIPPSITMILFAVVTRQSVAACFAATIGPALLLIVGLILYNRFLVGRAFVEHPPAEVADVGLPRIALNALPALSLPAIILGGIYGGVFTPTEAAAVAVAASLVVGGLIYRDFTLKNLRSAVVGAVETTGTIILILLFSFMISRILAAERIPQEITEAVQLAVGGSELAALLVVNLVLIIAGMLMDDVSVTVVVAPLFLPVMSLSGVDPVHFAAIVACSVVIGANSPPVAPVLFMACRICRAPVMGAVMPALGLMGFVALPVLLLTTFWPPLALAIPRWLGLM